MEQDKEDFGLTPVNTPLDWLEARRMQMSFFVVPRRLVKIKRLVDTLYSKSGNNV
jgi:hypothetical protein